MVQAAVGVRNIPLLRYLPPPFRGQSRGLPIVEQSDSQFVRNDFHMDILAEVSQALTARHAANTPAIVEDQVD